MEVAAPTSRELTSPLECIVERVWRHVEHRGMLERDQDQAWLSEAGGGAGPLDGRLGASITYRIGGEGPRGTSSTRDGEPSDNGEGMMNVGVPDRFALRGVVYYDQQGGGGAPPDPPFMFPR
jgi:hypothetical protein